VQTASAAATGAATAAPAGGGGSGSHGGGRGGAPLGPAPAPLAPGVPPPSPAMVCRPPVSTTTLPRRRRRRRRRRPHNRRRGHGGRGNGHQPFSPQPCAPTGTQLLKIGLHAVAKADWCTRQNDRRGRASRVVGSAPILGAHAQNPLEARANAPHNREALLAMNDTLLGWAAREQQREVKRREKARLDQKKENETADVQRRKADRQGGRWEAKKEGTVNTAAWERAGRNGGRVGQGCPTEQRSARDYL